MLTPRRVEPTTSPAARPPQQPRRSRALPSAVYVAYRRRSATGAVRVATGLRAPTVGR